MILDRARALREKLAAGHPAWGVALATGSPLVAEQLGTVGFDWVMIDQEHSPVSSMERMQLLQALSIGTSTPLVRVAAPDPVQIGQALDAGACGVVVPGVDDPEVAAVVAAAFRYPPAGTRGIGPYRPILYAGPDFVEQCNRQLLCLLMVESVAAVEQLDAILGVPGIDGVLVGPADLALSSGSQPSALEHQQLCAAVLEQCRNHEVIAGMFVLSGEAARPLAEAGWQLLGVGLDSQLLLAGARAALSAATG